MVIIMNNKVKRIAAMTALILIVLMYLVSFLLGIFATEAAPGMFLASVFSTVAIPIMVYIFLQLYKLRRRKTHPEEE